MTTATVELVTYQDPVELSEHLAITGFRGIHLTGVDPDAVARPPVRAHDVVAKPRRGTVGPLKWIPQTGFLAGYIASTRTSYGTDLRIFASWCHANQLTLLGVRRVHLELFARWMEAEGRMRSTVARRLSTLASFYRYCHAEGIVARNPAVNVRRPKVDHESRTLVLDRNELGALLVQAGLGTPRDHALVTLLAMNGLRISEALDADVADLDTERGHRTLRIVRKGGKHVTMPLAPRTARALDLYIGERIGGPIFLTGAGRRMDRSAADRIVKRLARRAGITKQISPHSLRHTFITLALDAGVALARRAGGGIARRPAHDDALRPRPPVPRLARHLHRRRLRRRRLPEPAEHRTSEPGDTERRVARHRRLRAGPALRRRRDYPRMGSKRYRPVLPNALVERCRPRRVSSPTPDNGVGQG